MGKSVTAVDVVIPYEIHHGFTSFLMKFTMVLLQCSVVTFNHVVFSADRLQLYKHSLSRFKVQGFFICHIIVIQGIIRSEM